MAAYKEFTMPHRHMLSSYDRQVSSSSEPSQNVILSNQFRMTSQNRRENNFSQDQNISQEDISIMGRINNKIKRRISTAGSKRFPKDFFGPGVSR